MMSNVMEMFAKYEVVGVAVSDDNVDSSFMVNIDDYSLENNKLTFGDADQEVTIKNVDRYEVAEFVDEVLLINKDRNSQIALCFIR